MSDRRVPDILIEQYVLGELPPEKAREVETSRGFAERVAAIEHDNADFARRYPAEAFVTRIANQYEAEQRSKPKQSDSNARTAPARFRPLLVIMPGAAALLALTFVLFGGLGVDTDPRGRPDSEIGRLKGMEPSISIYRSTIPGSTDAEELTDGSTARAGDRLQITYNAGDRPFGTIISVDGRATVTLHFPLTPATDPDLQVGGDQQLPYAYQLDDAPSFERFFFITADRSFEVSTVLNQIREQADEIAARPGRELILPDYLTTQSVTIRKGD